MVIAANKWPPHTRPDKAANERAPVTVPFTSGDVSVVQDFATLLLVALDQDSKRQSAFRGRGNAGASSSDDD